jgi:hypothetical protein
MAAAFRRGCKELDDVWKIALQPQTLAEIRRLSCDSAGGGVTLRLEDDLWTKVVFDFSWAYRSNPVARGQLLPALTPLYLGRVASFVRETESLGAHEVEERIERLCVSYERLKPYLISLWKGEDGPDIQAKGQAALAVPAKGESDSEVGNV